ncbi:MAG: hypothetical protein RL347_2122 [Actinomycetota bacterium]
MKSPHRTFIGVVSGALVLGGGLVATPPAVAAEVDHASGGSGRAPSISVAFVPTIGLLISSGLSDLGLSSEEFIEVVPFAGQQGAYVVRIYDYSQDALGSPLLEASSAYLLTGSCAPANVAVAQLVCTGSAPITSVDVKLSLAQSPVNFAVMDGAPIELNYQGSLGADYVQGGSGNDRIDGVQGNDFLFGGGGDDYIDGGLGDDVIEGEQGRDDMRGGAGSNSLDAADGIADVRVDCGGTPAFLDYDDKLDTPTNCGANPTPIPPGPVEPIDPPAPGQAEGTVDGVPTNVEVGQGVLNRPVFFSVPQGPIFNTGLLWLGPTAPMPTFPLNSLFFPVDFAPLLPNTFVNVSIWDVPTPPGPTPLSRAARSAPVENVEIRVNAQGVAKGNVPVPQGQEPGNFVMQINGVTSTGGQMSINVGVVLAEKTPEPDPGPDESIAITSATRGKGKNAATITVKGTATGLAGSAVNARYKLDHTKAWVTGPAVTVGSDGSYVLRIKTPKKVRIQVVSGAIRSPGKVVAAIKR